MSTLGIVEATVFLVHHYYEDLNITVERMFAEVHFTLFFVAIINALMSSLLYFLATKVAEQQWDRMETVDLDHYVAVRRQFDALEEQMKAIRDSERGKRRNRNECSEIDAGEINVFEKVMQHAKYPRMLNVKYNRLLVQVRFHELRIHFIESNDLDPKFKVSDYLRLCMNDVFIKLVHISSFSWLILLACTNLLYYLMGIVAAYAKDQQAIGFALSLVYIAYAVSFVIITYCIAWKMKQIFFKIMKNEKWITRDEDENNGQEGEIVRHSQVSLSLFLSIRSWATHRNVHQLQYFWFGDPSLIVVAAQFMQFGYALSLSILLVFNQTIVVEEIPFRWWGWYCVVPIVCYVIFVWLWSSIIPQYTQCTSLGELVNKKHLNDTQAMFELNVARLHRQEEIDYAETEKAIKNNMANKSKKKKKELDSDSKLMFLKRMLTGGGSSHLRVKDDMDVETSSDGSLSQSQKLVRLSELVKTSSHDLPEFSARPKRPRNRSLSDGVAAMRLFAPTSAVAAEALNDEVKYEPNETSRTASVRSGSRPPPVKPLRQKRTKSASTGVFLMQCEQSKPIYSESETSTNTTAVTDIGNASRASSASSASLTAAALRKVTDSDCAPLAAAALGECIFPYGAQTDEDEMPKRLQQKKFITTICEEDSDEGTKEVDDASISSDTSIVDDISEAPDIEDSNDNIKKVQFSERLCLLFLKNSYRQASAVFGTMVAFFMLAIRIELILMDTCTIPGKAVI